MRKLSLWMIAVTAALFLTLPASSAFAAKLTVGQATGAVGSELEIPIVVDNSNLLAGAAFTVTFPAGLTVQVDSVFFDTFQNQFAAAELDQAEIDAILAGNDTGYDQPLVTNTVEGTKLLIAAARCQAAGDQADVTIFTLKVTSNTAGTFPISIIPTTLNNTAAGYAAEGEQIDLLVGSDTTKQVTDPLAFPVLLAAAGFDANVTAGQAVFTEACDDTDEDGMCDDWEQTNFGNLTTAGPNTDFDQDGYLDKVEEDNNTNPKTQDPPGGDGYDPATDNRVGCSFDIDGNGTVDALSDGVLLIRYLFGMNLGPDTWIDGCVGEGAERDTATEIETFIADNLMKFDIDDNGNVDALSDGVLLIRYLFGMNLGPDTWIDGCVAEGAQRDTADEIEAYIATCNK